MQNYAPMHMLFGNFVLIRTNLLKLSHSVLSSNRNIDTICQLIEELKRYVELKTDGLQIDIVSKLSKLLSALIIGAIIFMIVELALIFVSMMIAAALTSLIGNATIAYALIVCAYALIAWIIYCNRTKWIENPITNFLAHLFIENQMENEQYKDSESKK